MESGQLLSLVTSPSQIPGDLHKYFETFVFNKSLELSTNPVWVIFVVGSDALITLMYSNVVDLQNN